MPILSCGFSSSSTSLLTAQWCSSRGGGGGSALTASISAVFDDWNYCSSPGWVGGGGRRTDKGDPKKMGTFTFSVTQKAKNMRFLSLPKDSKTSRILVNSLPVAQSFFFNSCSFFLPHTHTHTKAGDLQTEIAWKSAKLWFSFLLPHFPPGWWWSGGYLGVPSWDAWDGQVGGKRKRIGKILFFLYSFHLHFSAISHRFGSAIFFFLPLSLLFPLFQIHKGRANAAVSCSNFCPESVNKVLLKKKKNRSCKHLCCLRQFII